MSVFKRRKPWSRRTLHLHLLHLLDRPTTQVKLRTKLNNVEAECIFDDKFPPAYIKIEVDANNAEVERAVMHELLHVAFSELTLGKVDLTLEEVLIVGLEHFLWPWIEKSPARHAKWKKLVAKKTKEWLDSLPDLPHEDKIDRRGDERPD